MAGTCKQQVLTSVCKALQVQSLPADVKLEEAGAGTPARKRSRSPVVKRPVRKVRPATAAVFQAIEAADDNLPGKQYAT